MIREGGGEFEVRGSRFGNKIWEGPRCENKIVSRLSSKTASHLASIFSDRLAPRTLHLKPTF
jgi:hypothetical protein